jgi:hypothetical protein
MLLKSVEDRSTLKAVRGLLDNLGELRSQRDLEPTEERQYQELCVTELTMLHPVVQA